MNPVPMSTLHVPDYATAADARLNITFYPPIGAPGEFDTPKGIPTLTDLRRAWRKGRPTARFQELLARREAAIAAGKFADLAA